MGTGSNNAEESGVVSGRILTSTLARVPTSLVGVHSDQQQEVNCGRRRESLGTAVGHHCSLKSTTSTSTRSITYLPPTARTEQNK